MKEQEDKIDLESAWGAPATHSDYAIGAHVAYMQGKERYTGRIVYACASTGPDLPLRYVVERDGTPSGMMPDIAWAIDLIERIG